MKSRAIQSVFLTATSRPAEPSTRALVLGGDSIGLLVAERLADEGFPVILLGYPNRDISVSHGVTLIADAHLQEIRGFSGAFDAVINNSSGRWVERVGFVVAAQPAELVPKFDDYRVRQSRRNVSLSELEHHLQSKELSLTRSGEWLHVAFLFGLCGESEPAIFSRVLSVIEKLRHMEKVQSYVFTRNVKVAADGLERRYRESRDTGTVFFKFDDGEPVFQDTPNGTVLKFREPLLGLEMELIPDLLVVDERLKPSGSLKPLLDSAPLSLLSAPFLLPESIRFPGVQTPKAGIFAVGPSRGMFDPAAIETDVESVITALRESQRKVHDERLPGPPVIDQAKCTMCLTCLRLCPHGAVTFGVAAEVDPVTCVRCGICAAECPMVAITLSPPSGDPAIELRIREGLSGATGSRKILAFVCSRSADQALEELGGGIVENLIPVVVPCAGTISVRHVLEAFRQGADAVIAAGCFQGNCASGYGTILAEERISQVRQFLDETGIDPHLVEFIPTAGNTPGALDKALRAMEDRIRCIQDR